MNKNEIDEVIIQAEKLGFSTLEIKIFEDDIFFYLKRNTGGAA